MVENKLQTHSSQPRAMMRGLPSPICLAAVLAAISLLRNLENAAMLFADTSKEKSLSNTSEHCHAHWPSPWSVCMQDIRHENSHDCTISIIFLRYVCRLQLMKLGEFSTVLQSAAILERKIPSLLECLLYHNRLHYCVCDNSKRWLLEYIMESIRRIRIRNPCRNARLQICILVLVWMMY